MKKDKKATIEVKGTTITVLSKEVGDFNYPKFEGIRNEAGWAITQREGAAGYMMGFSDVW